MNEVLQLCDQDLPGRNQADDSEGFIEVVNRRRQGSKSSYGMGEINMTRKTGTTRKVSVTKGTAPTDAGDLFKARPSKIWLYVGRAEQTVTEAEVTDYIVKKCSVTDKSEVEVKKLDFIGRSSAFQVGVDTKYQDSVNNPEFWPAGIIVRRFKFPARKPRQTGAFLGIQQNPTAAV